MRILPLPAFTDNYIWLLTQANQQCCVVDPGDATVVFRALEQQHLQLTAILVTHHHFDHTGGVSELQAHFGCPVFGPSLEANHITHRLVDGDQIHLEALDLTFRVLDIPGHTRGHIAFYGHGIVFCGDTLFAGGCGRLFEGTAAELYASLTKLSALPDETQIYCGHEYTQKNLCFASLVEPDNAALAQRLQAVTTLRTRGTVTLPSTILTEQQTNPFLRCQEPTVIANVKQHSRITSYNPVDVFAALRQWKDNY